MKEVIYNDGIKRERAILPLAEQATARLDQIVKDFAPIVSAEWDLNNGQGPPEVTLRMWEDTGSVTTHFPVGTLRDADETYGRLLRLWIDLLSVRNHVLQKRLEEKFREYQEGERGETDPE